MRSSGQAMSDELQDSIYRTAPEEAARDLAVIEAILKSSGQDGHAVAVHSIPQAHQAR